MLCGGCVVSLERFDFPPEVIEQLQETNGLFNVELDDVKAEELGVISGSVMLKDETPCIRCGLCAARCPAGTITMESYNLIPAEPTGLISVESIDALSRIADASRK